MYFYLFFKNISFLLFIFFLFSLFNLKVYNIDNELEGENLKEKRNGAKDFYSARHCCYYTVHSDEPFNTRFGFTISQDLCFLCYFNFVISLFTAPLFFGRDYEIFAAHNVLSLYGNVLLRLRNFSLWNSLVKYEQFVKDKYEVQFFANDANGEIILQKWRIIFVT